MGPPVWVTPVEKSDLIHELHDDAWSSGFPAEMLFRILLASLAQVSEHGPPRVTADVERTLAGFPTF